jgi:cytochrome c-type biogenesis protein CcmH
VCRSVSVADSTTPLAREMRRTIEAQLRSGRSTEEIVRFFTDRYGAWILLDPAGTGYGAIAWASALGVWLAAAVGVAVLWRRHGTPTGDDPADARPPVEARR